ncbi:hypothetical protein ElyMa_000467100 [Elysia marginata]|uniref:Secreted protein n=1 Tax=Elysia marginata TaxID=1093978 RepID=A0AAV4FRC2_9GAST|nr:hypothetical protein ElyMa_000467100 [Elysia marginata]
MVMLLRAGGCVLACRYGDNHALNGRYHGGRVVLDRQLCSQDSYSDVDGVVVVFSRIGIGKVMFLRVSDRVIFVGQCSDGFNCHDSVSRWSCRLGVTAVVSSWCHGGVISVQCRGGCVSAVVFFRDGHVLMGGCRSGP